MGAEPYWYFEKYNGDVNESLQTLREREFKAGRYNPVIPHPDFPPNVNSPSPGPQHASIEEAMEDAAEDGTRSILNLDHISDYPDMCAVVPLSDDVLQDIYGTTQPTRSMIEEDMDFLDDLERGHGVYILLYKGGQPDEVLFAGYSFD